MFTFAHYWGIDEIGIFVIPAVLAIVGLRWAERKTRARAEEREADAEHSDSEEQADVE